MNSSYLVANLKASQTPQQNPTAKNCFTPLVSRKTRTFQKFCAMIVWSCPLMFSTMAGPMSPEQGVTSISGRKTSQCRLAKMSATLRCLPLVAPKISEMMRRTRLLPWPTWQTGTPSTLRSCPLGWQLACSCSQEPVGQQLIQIFGYYGCQSYALSAERVDAQQKQSQIMNTNWKTRRSPYRRIQ